MYCKSLQAHELWSSHRKRHLKNYSFSLCSLHSVLTESHCKILLARCQLCLSYSFQPVSENNRLYTVSFPQPFVSCYLFHVPAFYSNRPTLGDQFVLAGVVGERKWLARQHFLQPVSLPLLWPAWKNRQEHLEYDSLVTQPHLEHNSPRIEVTKTQ